MTVLLRKLTRKSCLQFGKYQDVNIQSILNLKRHRYLRWVYFNMSMITFFDDILDEINLPEDYRIDKPGKNPELHEKLNAFHESKVDGFTLLKARNHFRRVKKSIAKERLWNDVRYFSRGRMSMLNQGHSV